jgi:hypothetical protein
MYAALHDPDWHLAKLSPKAVTQVAFEAHGITGGAISGWSPGKSASVKPVASMVAWNPFAGGILFWFGSHPKILNSNHARTPPAWSRSSLPTIIVPGGYAPTLAGTGTTEIVADGGMPATTVLI